MLNVIDNGRLVDSPVQHLGDEDALPDAGAVTVSIARWNAERETLIARGNVGLRVASTDVIASIVGDLLFVDRIALEFPKFADGRAYSHARVLRQRYGYGGELRAVGEVLRDQLYYMQRCGFDAMELATEAAAKAALPALTECSVAYQAAADDCLPVYLRDRRRLGSSEG